MSVKRFLFLMANQMTELPYEIATNLENPNIGLQEVIQAKGVVEPMKSVKDLLLACGFKLVKWQNPSIEWQFQYKDEWCFQWSDTFLSIKEFLKKYPKFRERFISCIEK